MPPLVHAKKQSQQYVKLPTLSLSSIDDLLLRVAGRFRVVTASYLGATFPCFQPLLFFLLAATLTRARFMNNNCSLSLLTTFLFRWRFLLLLTTALPFCSEELDILYTWTVFFLTLPVTVRCRSLHSLNSSNFRRALLSAVEARGILFASAAILRCGWKIVRRLDAGSCLTYEKI